MNKEEQGQLRKMLELFLNESLNRILLSNPVDPARCSRIRLRPLLQKGALVFQAEEQCKNQAFHRNLSRPEAASYLEEKLTDSFRQAQVESRLGQAVVLVSRRGRMTVKVKQRTKGKAEGPDAIVPASRLLEHNRRKRYILEEGIPVPFLVDLGVMTAEGRVLRSRYDKYRQINRFLEFVEDVLPELPHGREVRIIDFGCGKSYLTFAVYYYLKMLKEYPVRITGLDLKEDVIAECSRLADRCGYEGLEFQWGDIASYEGADQVDMVITLHACDTATDYALEKAVRWGARVILSVPCCQHELNRQINAPLLAPALGYGLVRERMAALFTDAIRGRILEYLGYRTQLLEFIDLEHTPKNILIRAVHQGAARTDPQKERELRELLRFLQVRPMLAERLAKELLQDSGTA